MPDYRRRYVPGGTYFLTVVTYQRRPIFSDAGKVELLRDCLRRVKGERPFDFVAGVVLPDHAHFLWTLPVGDSDYSTRVGRVKALFSKAIGAPRAVESGSREKHRESVVWQRRFWEHTVRDERDWENHFDYIHFNPVKHGLVGCPHEWAHSSFEHWVARGVYEGEWCCACRGGVVKVPYDEEVGRVMGE